MTNVTKDIDNRIVHSLSELYKKQSLVFYSFQIVLQLCMNSKWITTNYNICRKLLVKISRTETQHTPSVPKFWSISLQGWKSSNISLFALPIFKVQKWKEKMLGISNFGIHIFWIHIKCWISKKGAKLRNHGSLKSYFIYNIARNNIQMVTKKTMRYQIRDPKNQNMWTQMDGHSSTIDRYHHNEKLCPPSDSL